MKQYLKHLFIPHQGNDYKPHILREFCVSIILFLVLFMFASSIALPSFLSPKSFLASIYSAVIVDLTNENRIQDKLSPLKMNTVLSEAATEKAKDMADKGYFAHNSPDGLTPWYWISKVGYKFTYAGENLAIDFNDSKDVENAWMNSPKHRENILNGHFTDIGVGMANGIYQGRETVFVVQMFGTPQFTPVAVASKALIVSKSLAYAVASVATSSVKEQATKTPVLADSFVEVKNVKGDFIEQVPEPAIAQSNIQTNYSNWYERLLVNSPHTVRIIYIALAGLVVFSLLLFIFIEWRVQHLKNIAYGLLLLLIILTALYISRSLFLPEVLAY